MPHKGKISPEEKFELVESYISGKIGIQAVKQKYGITKQCLYEWVRLYKFRGTNGLIPSKNHRKYSVGIKKNAVEDYLSGTASLRDICTKYNISGHSMLQQWIMCYNSQKDFKQPKSGRVIYMTKGRKTTQAERG